MRTNNFGAVTLVGPSLALVAGCVERRVEYVPVQTAPVVVQAAPPTGVEPVPGSPAAAPTVVYQTPPPPQVEVVPMSPGPGYAWVPGYWGWNGEWVWVSGRYVVRPHAHAVWVRGHWSPHGRGYVWVGGRWR